MSAKELRLSELAKRLAALTPEQRTKLHALRRTDSAPSGDLSLEPRLWPTAAGPLSFGQERMWFLDQFTGGNPFYNSPFVLRMKGALQVEALEASLNSLVQRHDVLRTTLHSGEQRVGEPGALPLSRVDGRTWSKGDRAKALRDLGRKHVDLEQGPIVRATLLKLGREDHVLVLGMHHAVTDAWSADVCLDEIGRGYEAELGVSDQMPARSALQYRDFAVWQRESMRGERLDELLEHWRSRIGGAEQVIEVPPDRSRRRIPRHLGAVYGREMRRGAASEVNDFAASLRVTPFAALLTVHALVVRDLTGRDDMLIVTPFSNRRSETESLIGFFANQMPLRLQLDPGASYEELVNAVAMVVRDAQRGAELPYELLVRDLVPTRDVSRNPLVQIGYTHARLSGKPSVFGGVTMQVEFPDIGTSRIDLYTGTALSDDGLFVTTWYDTDLYAEGSVRELAERFERKLNEALSQPQIPIASGERSRPRKDSSSKDSEALTPIQRWFLAQGWTNASHFHQTALVDLVDPTTVAHVDAAIRKLVAAHEAMRLRVSGSSRARWSTWIAPAETHALVHATTHEAFDAAVEQAHHAIDLAAGPLVQAVLVGEPANGDQRLLIVAHHFVVDVRSWQVLLEDIGAALAASRMGQDLGELLITTPFAAYARAVSEFGRSPAVRAESAFWHSQLQAPRLPVDGRGPNLVASEATVDFVLEEQQTAALIRAAAEANVTTEDALLSSLATAIAGWTDQTRVGVHLERHGRDPVVPGVDALRTVGWLVARFPLAVPVDADQLSTLAQVHALRTAVPNGGIGYGAMYYPSDSSATPPVHPDLSFNFLGQVSMRRSERGLRLLEAPTRMTRSPEGTRPHSINVDARIVDARLKIRIMYSTSLHHTKTIERLAAGYESSLNGLALVGALSEGNERDALRGTFGGERTSAP